VPVYVMPEDAEVDVEKGRPGELIGAVKACGLLDRVLSADDVGDGQSQLVQ
jgi:hypothetical protein